MVVIILCASIALTIVTLLAAFGLAKLMRSTYEKRFKKNVRRHLDEMPKKVPAPPEETPIEQNTLSFALLERLYRQQMALAEKDEQQFALPYYKVKQTEAYIASLPTAVPPPKYDELNVAPVHMQRSSITPPPSYQQ